MVKTRKLPSSREKKRYIVIKVLSESTFDNPDLIKKAILDNCLKYIGIFGVEKTKLRVLVERFDLKQQKIILRTTLKTMNDVKEILGMIDTIENKKVEIKIIGVSGILKKAYKKYISEGE